MVDVTTKLKAQTLKTKISIMHCFCRFPESTILRIMAFLSLENKTLFLLSYHKKIPCTSDFIFLVNERTMSVKLQASFYNMSEIYT